MDRREIHDHYRYPFSSTSALQRNTNRATTALIPCTFTLNGSPLVSRYHVKTPWPHVRAAMRGIVMNASSRLCPSRSPELRVFLPNHRQPLHPISHNERRRSSREIRTPRGLSRGPELVILSHQTVALQAFPTDSTLARNSPKSPIPPRIATPTRLPPRPRRPSPPPLGRLLQQSRNNPTARARPENVQCRCDGWIRLDGVDDGLQYQRFRRAGEIPPEQRGGCESEERRGPDGGVLRRE